jgi:hypothetical protein
LAFSYWIDYLGFITEGKLAAIFIKPSLGVYNWPVIYYTSPHQLGNRSFLSPLPGIEEEAPTSSSSRHQSSPKEICWGATIYCSKQNKTKLKAKVKTLQEKSVVHKAIKI